MKASALRGLLSLGRRLVRFLVTLKRFRVTSVGPGSGESGGLTH